MRQDTTISGITIVYPDALVFEDDNNHLQVSGSGALGEVGLTINSTYGTAQHLVYTSPLRSIVFSLREALAAHMDAAVATSEDITDVTIEVRVAGDSTTLSFSLVHGRTLASRSHYAESVALSDGNPLQVLVPAAGGVTIHGGTSNGQRTTTPAANYITIPADAESVTIDLVQSWTLYYTVGVVGAPDYGTEYELTATGNIVTIGSFPYFEYHYTDYNGVVQTVYIQTFNLPTLNMIVVKYDLHIQGVVTDIDWQHSVVDRWEMGQYAESVDRWDVEVFKTCAKEKAVTVEWYNADGCKRSAVGELLLLSTGSEGDTMQRYRVDDVVRHSAYRHINTVQQTCRVGFAQIPHGAFIEDLLTSWQVTVDGVPAVPTTKSIGGMDNNDIAVEFELMN